MGGSRKKLILFRHFPKWMMIAFLLAILVFSFRKDIFDAPYSTVVMDKNGALLGAQLAKDEQWRFPLISSVPEKFKKCILTQEDRYFDYHPGINPYALWRAAYLNLKSGKVISGGSTISMQVIRLSGNNPPRTFSRKLWEMFLALSLETGNSKDDILKMYVSHAPFGGNIVGLEAASWRYFQRPPESLSWAESACLAVLPNAPGLIHPGRNRDVLLEKRNTLLKKLYKDKVISEETLALSLLEDIPDEPKEIPRLSPHLVTYLSNSMNGKSLETTIEASIQWKAEKVLHSFEAHNRSNHVYNGAVLIIENNTGAVKAYVGNIVRKQMLYGEYNDMINTPRSSGSILKPFLYAQMLSEGEMLPEELQRDIPTLIGTFKPENFVKNYEGAVPADEALARSLNIPAVWQLKKLGIEKFKNNLHKLGFTTINRTAENYGLSLILGGAEVNMWDLGQAYYQLARLLSSGPAEEIHEIPAVHILKSSTSVIQTPNINKGAVYQTFEALREVHRPDSEMGWQFFDKADIAWKTGTSFGFRDAWAVGISKKYTCVVWMGNSSGEGRPGLVGAPVAGPVLFDIMNSLPQDKWFDIPHEDMEELEICEKSGLLAANDCPATDMVLVPDAITSANICSYHQSIYTDPDGNFRYNLNCAGEGEIEEKKYFVLPAAQAWFYQKNRTDYTPVPPWYPGCEGSGFAALDVIYPQQNAKLFIPRDLDGLKGKIILEAAHQRQGTTLYWHLNKNYLGSTENFHQMALNLTGGEYLLHIEDSEGNVVYRKFTVKEK